MDKTLNTGSNLYECTVVSDSDDFTLDGITDLKVSIEAIPRMLGELLETESDPLLLLVEIKDDDLDLFIEGNNLLRVIDTTPGKICNMDETVHTAEVDEYAVVGDVLDGSFENLTLFEFGNEFGPLLLLLCLEQCLM